MTRRDPGPCPGPARGDPRRAGRAPPRWRPPSRSPSRPRRIAATRARARTPPSHRTSRRAPRRSCPWRRCASRAATGVRDVAPPPAPDRERHGQRNDHSAAKKAVVAMSLPSPAVRAITQPDPAYIQGWRAATDARLDRDPGGQVESLPRRLRDLQRVVRPRAAPRAPSQRGRLRTLRTRLSGTVPNKTASAGPWVLQAACAGSFMTTARSWVFWRACGDRKPFRNAGFRAQ